MVLSEILLLSGPDELFVDVCLLMDDTVRSCSPVSVKPCSERISLFYIYFSDCWGDRFILCCHAVSTKLTTLSEEWICK